MSISGMSSVDSLMSQSYAALSNIHHMTDTLRPGGTSGTTINGLSSSSPYQLMNLSSDQLFNLACQMPVTSSQDFISGKLPLDYYSKVIGNVGQSTGGASIYPTMDLSTLTNSSFDISQLFNLLLAEDTSETPADNNNSTSTTTIKTPTDADTTTTKTTKTTLPTDKKELKALLKEIKKELKRK